MQSTSTQMVHGSTDRAFPDRGPDGSYRSSPCSHRVPLGQNIMRRVLVSIMVCLAFGAAPLANGQRQFFQNVAASRTAFAAREPAVNFDQLFPIPVAFVFQQPAKQSERSIRQAASKGVVFDHSSQVQIFDADHVEAADEIGSDFLQMVHASVRNVGMDLGYAKASTFAALAAFVTPCVNSLRPSEFLFSLTKIFWIGDSFAVGKGSQSADAEVDTDRLISFRQRRTRLIHHKSHEIPASSVLFNRHRSRMAFKRTRPPDTEPAELGNDQISIACIPFEGALGIFSSLLPVLFFERWVSGAFVEEVAESGLEMPEGLLNRYTGNFVEPSVIWSLFECRESRRTGMVAHFLSGMVGISPQSQSPVVNVSTGSECLSKDFFLFERGVKPVAVIHLHMFTIAHVKIVVKLSRSSASLLV